jgi:hypothetical protein
MVSGQFWPGGAEAGPGTPPPEEETPMIIGANVHPAWDEQASRPVREAIRDGLLEGGITSVRLDFAWDQIEPTKGNWTWTKLDDIIDVYSDEGMTVIPMLYWPPPWARGSGSGKGAVPRDPVEYGTAVGKIGQRYLGKLAAVEMWNEPDLTAFWSGTRLQYAQLLAGAYPVAKGLAPATTFLAAASTYLGLHNNWFADMFNTGLYGPGLSHDAQSIHPYMSASNLPPDTPASNYSLHGIANLQTLRAAEGDTSPLWATEFGWSTHSNPGGLDPWKLGVTEAQHADYTVEAFEIMATYGVVAGYPYTDRDIAAEADPHEHNFGLLYADNSPKPVIAALAAMPVIVPDLEARVIDLEERVAILEANDAELAAHLTGASDDLKE